jgi:type II secretory pathway component PulK
MSLELKLTQHALSQLKDLYAAKAAILRAMEVIRRDTGSSSYDSLNEPWANSSALFENREVGEAKFSIRYIYDYRDDGSPIIYYGLIDEERKINLNLGNLDNLGRLMNNLMRALDKPDKSVTLTPQIIDSIIDWRDPPSDEEASLYDYPCRNGEFKVLEELLLLKGVKEIEEREARLKKFQDLGRYLTIYGDGKINVNTASLEILEAVIPLVIADVTKAISEYVKREFGINIVINVKGEPSQIAGQIFERIHENAGGAFATIDELLDYFLSDILELPTAELPPDILAGLLSIIKTIIEPEFSKWLKTDSQFFQANVEAQIKQVIKKQATVVFDRGQKTWYWNED